MLYFWEILVDIGIVIGLCAVIYGGYRLGRMLYRKHKEKKLMKNAVRQKVLDKQNVQDKAQVQEKVKSKFKIKNNVFSTIENYLPKAIKNKKYSKLRSGLYEGSLEPDYVKTIKDASGNVYYDKRTYIQCFDEEVATEFQSIVSQNTEDDLAVPSIAEIRFNKDSGIAPLIVSATNQYVYEKGVDILDAKAQALAEEYQNIFPVSYVSKVGKTVVEETYNDLSELSARNDINPEIEFEK